jgi:fatty-acyl-CoA synthase
VIHGDVLGERARLAPRKVALVDVASGRRFTYAELDERAARTGRALREGIGLAKGDRVAFLAHNRVEFLDVLFACAKTGIVMVPLSTRLTANELAGILADAEPKALIFGDGFEETVEDLLRRGIAGRGVALDATPARWERSKEEEEEEDLLRKGNAAAGAAGAPRVAAAPPRGRPLPLTFKEILSLDLTTSEKTEGFGRPDPEDLLALLYTSGTTGKPKGVMIPHRMVGFNAVNTALSWQLREDDVSPLYTPLYHAGGIGAFLAPILAIGGTIVLHAGFDPAEILATIAKERATVVLGVPTIFRLLAEHAGFASADFSSVRWFISGGAPLPMDVIERYQARGVAFKQGYGLTEVGVNCFSMTVEDSVRKAGSIGKPMMFTEARLLRDDGQHAGDGEVGELLLRGPHVCQGYFRNPAATAEALDAEGWFHTGDLAKRDADGFYTIAGRKKDMFISGGVNVYPAEIEGVLFQHPGVKDVAVVGVPDDKWGEVGIAFVVRRKEKGKEEDSLNGEEKTGEGKEDDSLKGRATGAELAAFVEGRLARYKVPREFVFVDSLPRTPYGKVVKSDLLLSYPSKKSPSSSSSNETR